jgi:hypothetical protein
MIGYNDWVIIYQHLEKIILSMDWFKGKFTGKKKHIS